MANSRLCSIPNCGKPHIAQGLCNKHYKRMKKHGDPLRADRTLSERGEPLAYLREHLTKTHGEDACVFWPFGKNDQGYGNIRFNGSNEYVHRIVCTHHHGEPTPEADKALHSCGNGHLGCINEQHLRWGTLLENQADSRMHGTLTLGENVPSSKLSADVVREIRSGVFHGLSQLKIAHHFGVSQRTISDIINGKTWRHLP